MKTYSSKLEFKKDWDNPSFVFKMKTSGSTGKQKEIVLKKNLIITSVNSTLQAIGEIKNLKMLCCLPTDKMGGFMQLARSVSWESEIEVHEPSSNPMLGINTDHDFRLISLSPHQIGKILQDTDSLNKLHLFDVVLIGGASLNQLAEQKLLSLRNTSFYVTYGMTETYSHVAIRELGHTYYKLLNKVEGRLGKDGVLELKGAVTHDKWLQTEDIVEFKEEGIFKLLGRKQGVVNSGGIKFFTEQIEELLSPQLIYPFFITKVEDDIYGETIALVSSPAEKVDLEKLNEILQNKLGKHAKIRKQFSQNITFDPTTGKVKRVVVS